MRFIFTAFALAAGSALVSSHVLQRRADTCSFEAGDCYPADFYRVKTEDISIQINIHFTIPVFKFPNPGPEIKACAKSIGKDLQLLVKDVHAKIKAAGMKIKEYFSNLKTKVVDGWYDFVSSLKRKSAGLSFKLHMKWKRLKDDAARVLFWADCDLVHFKHWIEYRDKVLRGEVKVYSKFAHELMYSLRIFEATQAAKFKARMTQLRSIQVKLIITTYKVEDDHYVMLVGRKDNIDGQQYDWDLAGAQSSLQPLSQGSTTVPSTTVPPSP
jgi:hypothetical protein